MSADKANSNIVGAIKRHRIIAILRGVPPEQVALTARALYEGGVKMLEITFNQNSATKISDTVQSIESVLKEMNGSVRVGAGTVMSPEEVHAAADAGAEFILAPDTNREVIAEAVNRGIAAIPGAMTPTEIAEAYRFGAAAVKLFPAGSFGVSYMKAVTAPLNHIPLLVVGGVDEKNVGEFIKAGAIGAGIGSALVSNKLIEAGRFDEITQLAKNYTRAACEGKE